jgi:hypothetical protein
LELLPLGLLRFSPLFFLYLILGELTSNFSLIIIDGG